jgi:hypothetical protein
MSMQDSFENLLLRNYNLSCQSLALTLILLFYLERPSFKTGTDRDKINNIKFLGSIDLQLYLQDLPRAGNAHHYNSKAPQFESSGL